MSFPAAVAAVLPVALAWALLAHPVVVPCSAFVPIIPPRSSAGDGKLPPLLPPTSRGRAAFAPRWGRVSSSLRSSSDGDVDGRAESSSPPTPTAFPPVPVRSHHTCVKTRSMEMALAFYSLLGYRPEAKFRAGPARAAWLTNVAASAPASENGGQVDAEAGAGFAVPSRIEIIEVPPEILDEAEGVTKRAADRFGNPALLGLDHLCLDVTSSVLKARREGQQSSKGEVEEEESSSAVYGLSEWMDDLQSASTAKFGKTLRVALAPRVKRIGKYLIEMAYIYDADGSLLELINCDVHLTGGDEGGERGEESSWDDEDDGRIVWKAG